jgi:2-polyprenyl-6-hydroxyphenyl methylase/3-demethylubiquinone-9 3-methyltransferase
MTKDALPPAPSHIDNDLYNRLADTWWDENGSLHLLKALLNPWRVPYFQRLLRQRKLDSQGTRALDVGCGGGLLAEEFAALGLNVTGIDPSEKSLAVARAHATQSGLHIDYRLGSGDALPFETGSFALVSCCDVLEHIPQWDAVIGEIARVLKPGGVFLYDTINRTLYSKLVVIKLAQEWAWTRFLPLRLHAWEMFITPAELTRSLNRHGLQNQEFVGTKAGSNPLKLFLALRRYRAGKISGAEFGRRAGFTEGTNVSGSYMGCAVKRDIGSREGRPLAGGGTQ